MNFSRRAGLAPAYRMKQRLRINHVIRVNDIPVEEVVVHRPAGARPALRNLSVVTRKAGQDPLYQSGS